MHVLVTRMLLAAAAAAAAAAGVRGLGKAAYRDVVQKLVANSGRV